MEELIGQRVLITFDSHIGMISTIGKVLKANDKMVVLQTSSGPLYVMLSFVKTISTRILRLNSGF